MCVIDEWKCFLFGKYLIHVSGNVEQKWKYLRRSRKVEEQI